MQLLQGSRIKRVEENHEAKKYKGTDIENHIFVVSEITHKYLILFLIWNSHENYGVRECHPASFMISVFTELSQTWDCV